jgi:hypothetical protein
LPDWPAVDRELRRKGVTLQLVWEEYRAAHPNRYCYIYDGEESGAIDLTSPRPPSLCRAQRPRNIRSEPTMKGREKHDDAR